MAQYVLASGSATPDKPALIIAGDTDQVFNFAEITARVRGFGAGLLARGLRPGDKVLLRLGNSADFPISYLGAIAVGCVPVPTSAQLTEPETAAIIAELNPALILHDPDVLCAPSDRAISPAEIAQMQSLPPADWDTGDPNRLAYIVYTSGTSGRPRAVCHAHRAIWARQMMHQGWYGLGSEDRMLHAGAFNWTFTLGTGVMDPWSVGATAIVPAPGTPIAALRDCLARTQATLFAAAPGVYRKLLTDPEPLELPHLRHGLAAGEKLPAATAQAWTRATGTGIFEAYGQSECSTFISGSPDAPAPPGTLGRPQPGRRVAILQNGTPAPLGETGDIAIHKDDPGLMRGYLGEDGPPLTGDWFDTGDLGAMAADGAITYHGRADDMMNAGGYRVSPQEVEAALHDAPGLHSLVVTQIEVKPDVHIIAAFYTAETPLDDAALHRYADERLAHYKCPRAYVHIPALPTGPNGKISRKALKQYWTAS